MTATSAGDGIDELLAQPVSGLPVDLAEADPFGGRRGREEGDRTGDKRQFEVALPLGARGHEFSGRRVNDMA